MAADLILRGRTIREDSNGFLCLNDIHLAAGFRKNKRPYDWQRLPTTNPLIVATYERVTGISRKSKIRISEVYRATATGTWAHPILAASYAGYLKPELEVEMREVWLRYRAGDATLADDILQRATDEQNEWAPQDLEVKALKAQAVLDQTFLPSAAFDVVDLAASVEIICQVQLVENTADG